MEVYRFTKNLRLKILKALLDDQGFLLACKPAILPEYFPDDIEELICSSIFSHVDEYGAAPSIDVLDQLLRRNVSEKFSRPTERKQYARELRRVLSIIRKSSVKRDIPFLQKRIQVFAKICATQSALVQASQILPYARFDEIEALISKAVRHGSSALDLGDFLLNSQHVNALLSKKHSALGVACPTGWPSVDRLMQHGGVLPGEVGLVIGATGEGKSMALINIAVGALKGLFKVQHYTLENPKEKIQKRYAACFMKKPTNALHKHRSQAARFLGMLRKRLGIQVNVKEFPMGECSIGMIKQHLSMLEGIGYKPDTVVVDYAECMKADRSYKEVRFEYKAIYESLKALAQEKRIRLWTAQQGNREALEAQHVRMKNAGEHMYGIKIADYVLCICRTEEEKEDRKMRLYLGKNREGVAPKTLEFREAYDQARIVDESHARKKRGPRKNGTRKRRASKLF